MIELGIHSPGPGVTCSVSRATPTLPCDLILPSGSKVKEWSDYIRNGLFKVHQASPKNEGGRKEKQENCLPKHWGYLRMLSRDSFVGHDWIRRAGRGGKPDISVYLSTLRQHCSRSNGKATEVKV